MSPASHKSPQSSPRFDPSVAIVTDKDQHDVKDLMEFIRQTQVLELLPLMGDLARPRRTDGIGLVERLWGRAGLWYRAGEAMRVGRTDVKGQTCGIGR